VPLAQRRPERAGRGVGVLGEQHEPLAVHIGGVDPGGGHHEAVVGLHDPGLATGRHLARGLGGQHLIARGGPLRAVCRHVDQLTLRFGHDLAGDDEHVAVAQPRRRARDQRGQVITG
jgi:hypothetical protein